MADGLDFHQIRFKAMQPLRIPGVFALFNAPRAMAAAFGAVLALAWLFGAAYTQAATLRALVIGIDDYQHVQKLRGAVADARDVERALRAIGVADLRLVLNDQANRKTVLAAFEALVSATRPSDTVFVTLAGHGAQEPERIKGSELDGMDAVFLLQPFDPKDPDGASEKILDKEFNHYIKKIEGAGGRVVFVADTCSGGGLARQVDSRGADFVYRSVKYAPIPDHLVSVADRTDSFASIDDFQHSLFLAAVDKKSRAPELNIPGVGYRGALSYAFSRALEGAADVDGDGVMTAEEIFTYVRQVAHQLSDQRQVVVLERPAQEDPRRYVVAELTRGIAVRPLETDSAPEGGLVILPVDSVQDKPVVGNDAAGVSSSSRPEGFVPPVLANSPRRPNGGTTLRMASLDGQTAPLAFLQQQAQVALVSPNANPDLVWDPRTQDVLAGPDVIARNIAPSELPGVVERTIILEGLKQRAVRASQAIRLLPSDELHTKGTRIEIDVAELTNRYMVLFNLSGNGNIQLLYPLGSDPAQRRDPGYSVEFQVREPFGADIIVAATSDQRLVDLERLLRQSSRRLSPDRLSEVLSKAEPHGLRIGYVGVFTSP
jgi:hypothetical protein